MFGCLCYSSTISAHLDKFQPRSQACVLLGYPPATKGCKLLNLTSRKIFISRDVIFHESIFPFISLDSVYSFSFATSLPPVLDSTLTTLPFDSTSSPVFHDSFINNQHFASDVDSDSDIDDDASSSSSSDSLQDAHLADTISLAPSSPIPAAASSNDSHIPCSIPQTTLPANFQPTHYLLLPLLYTPLFLNMFLQMSHHWLSSPNFQTKVLEGLPECPTNNHICSLIIATR